jgi:hypothetical protein
MVPLRRYYTPPRPLRLRPSHRRPALHCNSLRPLYALRLLQMVKLTLPRFYFLPFFFSLAGGILGCPSSDSNSHCASNAAAQPEPAAVTA